MAVDLIGLSGTPLTFANATMAAPRHNETGADLVPFLPPGTKLHFELTVEEYAAALERAAGGPQVLSCEQAVQHLGRTVSFWRRVAKLGRIEGATQDKAGGTWWLPRSSCERYLQSGARGSEPVASEGALVFDASKARGPRKKRKRNAHGRFLRSDS